MSLLHRMLEVLLPSSCRYCHATVGDSAIPHFCASCWSDFSLLPGPFCPGCGRPFGSPETLKYSPDHQCASCRLNPPHFNQALSVGLFEGSLREAVHQFKYRPCWSLGRPLGDWMSEKINVLMTVDMIMPVPLHSSRLKQRGFNQALLLAHRMSKRFDVTLSVGHLVRVRPTRPQVELTGEERLKNVAGAFALRRPAVAENKHVVLVDDVFTTGATLSECAVVLKKAGARQITALTLARAM